METTKQPWIARFLGKSQLPFRIFLAAFFVDIFTKIIASEVIPPGEQIDFFGGFHLRGDIRNNSGNIGLFSFLWNGIVVACLYFWGKGKRRDPRIWAPLSLIVAGNLGNIAEILLRPSGVVDWICFNAPFGICTNIADLYIWTGYGTLMAGILFYILYAWRDENTYARASA